MSPPRTYIFRYPRSHLWLGLFLLLCGVTAEAQDPFSLNFDTEQGLPSSEIFKIAFEKNGKVWFATDRGLCSYNSYEFEVYSTAEGLTNNSVLNFETDPDGNLWMLNLDGSINYLMDGKLYAFEANDSLAKYGFRDQLTLGLAWDPQGRILLWQPHRINFKTYFRWDQKQRTWDNFSFEELEQSYPSFRAGHLKLLAPGHRYIPDTDLALLYPLSDDEFLYVRNNKRSIIFKARKGDPTILDSLDLKSNVMGIWSEDQHSMWISTAQGLYQSNRNLDPPSVQYFSGVPISALQKDREGNFWLATLDEGVKLVPSFAFKKPHYSNPDAQDQLAFSLTPLKNHLISSHIQGNIMALDQEFQARTIVQSPKHFSILNYPTSISAGVAHYPYFIRESGEGLEVTEKDWGFRSPNVVNYAGSQFACLGNTHYRWIDSLQQLESEQVFLQQKSLGRILSILRTPSGILLGTVKGLVELRGPVDSLYPVSVYQDYDALQSRINHLVMDPSGRILVGTMGKGVAILMADTIFVIDQSKGLAGNMVNRVRPENDSILWVATNRGVDRIRLRHGPQPEIISVDHLNSADGLPSNFVRDVAIWQGHVWLATNKGLVYFQPDEVFERALPRPQIALDSVLVNRIAVPPDSTPILSYSENDLAFEFTAVSFRKPTGQPFYRFRLLGQDSSWTYTSQRGVQYPGLPSGSYTFEVMARNRMGQWSADSARFQFEIRPHFSQTWWFSTLLVLLVVGILAGLYFYREARRRARQTQEWILQQTQLRAKEAELAALRNQMNPHFVFNALNSIQNFIFKKDAPKASYFLGRFAQLMRDGLEFSRSRLIALEDELKFLQAYLELESLRFPDKFSYSIDLDEELDPTEVMLPPFLFQPVLENALKHAFKNIDYPGLLEIRFQLLREDLLQVIIQDNGSGLHGNTDGKLKQLHTSRGLEIVRNQLELIDPGQKINDFRLENRKDGSGTIATFQISI